MTSAPAFSRAIAVVAAPKTLGPLLDAARAYAQSARTDATRRAYGAPFRAFQAWCEAEGLLAVPAEPPAVGVYLAHLAGQGRKVATIEKALAAIAYHHRANGHEWTRGHRAITEVMRGIRRTHGVAPSKKAPLEGDELRAVLRTLDGSLRGLRDRALLLVGWFGAFRRSELASLDRADVTFASEGLVVRLRQSKTDQEKKGLEKGLPYAGAPELCPVRALRAWLDAAPLAQGPLFRAVNRHGQVSTKALSDRSVARVVQRAATAAGLAAARFGGHSLRSGFATMAARKGRSLDAIMRQTGHRSERVARGYIRHGTLFVDNAAAGLF